MDSSGRIRLVHLATRLPVGGMEYVVDNLVRGLPANRYELSVCCLERADQLGSEMRAQGADLVEVGGRHRRPLPLLVRLANLMRSRRFHIVHCHDEVSWFYGTI